MLKPRQLERIAKGFANHRRIQIMELINNKPELSVADISRELNINFKTASEHIRRLAISGLVLKRNRGVNVLHKLSNQGFIILKFFLQRRTGEKIGITSGGIIWLNVFPYPRLLCRKGG